jgi:hypothetical protein
MVTFDAAENRGGDRTGTLTVGGQTFTVTQRGEDELAGLFTPLLR